MTGYQWALLALAFFVLLINGYAAWRLWLRDLFETCFLKRHRNVLQFYPIGRLTPAGCYRIKGCELSFDQQRQDFIGGIDEGNAAASAQAARHVGNKRSFLLKRSGLPG